FQEIVNVSTSVLVIDNYSSEISRELSDMLAVGWKVILISRKQPAENVYPILSVDALTKQADLYSLFEHNLGTPLQPADYPYLDNIIHQIDRHTLVLELIAKQIASSYLSIKEASELADRHGFAAMAPEKIIFCKDTDTCTETLRTIITALFEADHLSAQMKDLLKVMSLVNSSGINIRLLHKVLSIKSMDDANTLIRDGWIILSEKIISLHPVIRETVHYWDWSANAISYAVRLMKYLCCKLKTEEYPEVKSAELPVNREISRQQLSNHLQVSFPLQLAEGILESCRREPLLSGKKIYPELLYRTVIRMPRYREDFILERANELLHNSRDLHGIAIMKLYDCILSVYQERKEFGAASAALKEAEQAAKKFGNNYVWALYYDLLSNFYDYVLNGAYDAVRPDEKHLMEEMMEAIDKAIHYARKSHAPDSKPLLAKNILAKATILIRSEPERKKQINKLIAEAEKIVFAETQSLTEERCIFYMVRAWYATLVEPSLKNTLNYIQKASEISRAITHTDLDEIDNMIIPRADMMLIWQQYSLSARLLSDGIQSCEQNDSVIPYIRKKMELYRCLLDVCYEWDQYDLCRQIIAEIDAGNRKYQSVGVHIKVPALLRDLAFSGEKDPSNQVISKGRLLTP
ncbi:MAG: hypothetical protein LUE92_04045, partial [Clostridiales bacterium]|nr:hypothetical protein [Clostridiales bacterium]